MFGHLALILTAFRHYPESGGQNVSFHYYSHLTSLLCFLAGIVSCNNVGQAASACQVAASFTRLQ